MRELSNKLIKGQIEIPIWVVAGRTVLIPKGERRTADLSEYRPIACLNTQYKLLTRHVGKCELLPREQKAIKQEHRGCMDALWIDQMINTEAAEQDKQLSVAWIDFRKVFDSVPHEWLKIVLKAIGTPKRIRKTIGALVKKWRTCFSIGSEVNTESVKYKCGIFQGDSLSPLLYCLSVSPLSYALNQRKGIEIPHTQQRLTHLMFVDDLKLYANCPRELAQVVEMATEVSEAIGMQLGMDAINSTSNTCIHVAREQNEDNDTVYHTAT